MMIYFIYFGIGLLGMALQILLKIQSFKSRMESNRLIFRLSDYFKDDFISIILSFVALFLWMTFVPDIEKNYPVSKDWMRIFFGFVGYGGTSLLTWSFSKFDKRIKAASMDKAIRSDEMTGNLSKPTEAADPDKNVN